ncbi:hypothetical protein BDZ45DRAFT_248454 [Acephala macrosclerotiorum]|nr:hypothetical protein BDZ45DRAFT_248454 [Acephala macrosclerotiorum]
MVDISARLQSQEIREIFVTHLRLSPEKGEQVLGIYEKLRSAIILAKPIDFNKTLLTCKRHLEYPTDLGFYDDIDKYSEADKRANLITEITEAEVLWKLNKESAYQSMRTKSDHIHLSWQAPYPYNHSKSTLDHAHPARREI